MKKSLSSILCITILLVIFPELYSQEKNQKLNDLINKYHEYGQFNGSVLVSENGNVILRKGYGLAEMEWNILNTPDTKFRLGSITKQFTAMLIMQLYEEGKINTDEKLSRYLPYYKKEIGDKITIRNLLTHTSGIPNYTDDPDFMRKEIRNPLTVKELVKAYCSRDLEFEPGSKYSYSNSGYVILGAVIEELTGKKYEEVISEKILIPLGMKNTGYENNSDIIQNRASGYDKSLAGFTNSRYIDMSLPYAAGSLYSTVNDMFIWDQALYTDKLVSKETLEIIFTPYKDDYGFGWKIRDSEIGNVKKKLITHSGGIFGFNTIILRYPEDNNCIIILNNFSNGNISEMGKNMSAILYGQNYEMPKKSLTEILYKTINEEGLTKAVEKFNELKESKDEYYIREGEMNQLGYNLLMQNNTAEAIEVFKLNVEIFPNSANVYDSLGEAYLKSGNKELAAVNYRKTVEMNPENESAKKILNELEAE